MALEDTMKFVELSLTDSAMSCVVEHGTLQLLKDYQKQQIPNFDFEGWTFEDAKEENVLMLKNKFVFHSSNRLTGLRVFTTLRIVPRGHKPASTGFLPEAVIQLENSNGT